MTSPCHYVVTISSDRHFLCRSLFPGGIICLLPEGLPLTFCMMWIASDRFFQNVVFRAFCTQKPSITISQQWDPAKLQDEPTLPITLGGGNGVGEDI